MTSTTEGIIVDEQETSIGTLQIRVVVFEAPGTSSQSSTSDDDTIDDEPHLETGKRPYDSYLERPILGKQCIVFLVNGQKQHAFDNAFTMRDLGFKYLRNRLMVIVDLDGLAPQAISELMQGSRQEFYDGITLQAIRKRLIHTLKSDPDLQRLQNEAEQQIAELSAGDTVVRKNLDLLIEDHHNAAQHTSAGAATSGDDSDDPSSPFGKKKEKEDVVVAKKEDVGEAAEGPVIIAFPETPTIRLQPEKQRYLRIGSFPPEAWPKVTEFKIETTPVIPELEIKDYKRDDHIALEIEFVEPDGFDDDQYPLETTMRVFATFEGYKEVRYLERHIVISKPITSEPRPAPELKLNPTFIKATSRQPVRLYPGGPATHVKLRWDGKDELAVGAQPQWRFLCECESLANFPPFSITRPEGGRFELLIDTPPGLHPGLELTFRVDAEGPDGAKLTNKFSGIIVEPSSDPKARKLKTRVPKRLSARRPPYELVYIKRENWPTPTCWGSSLWTENEAGCFVEPSDTQPLTLIINQDFGLLDEFRNEMIERKLAESTAEKKMTRYTSHIAFHLYQMFESQQNRVSDEAQEENGGEPGERDLNAEINRVARTLLSLMKVAR
ncbi:MAG: hypothetical protein ACYS8W_05475 [Planctomycetota bacterium]|jgi:hypothetical protein